VYAGLGHFPPAEYTSDRVTALIWHARDNGMSCADARGDEEMDRSG
jgi:hypothetical protein